MTYGRRPLLVFFRMACVLVLPLWGCGKAGEAGSAGTGGSTTSAIIGGAGGGSGGVSSSGGVTISGGNRSTGGVFGTSGTSSSGGISGTGGSSSLGGNLATGGGTGGAKGSGGTTGTVGVTGVGGTRNTAGSPGAGGTVAFGGTVGSPDAGRVDASLDGSGSSGGSGGGGVGSGGTGAGGSTGACTPPAAGTKGKNPLFSDVYTADPAPFVYNCTFYINCGHDEGGGTGFVMNNWFILKSKDMVTWTRVDKALALSNFKWADSNAWAGQMVAKGGKFYWYVPVNKIGSCPNNCGMAIGVAVADSPEGPFTDPLGKPLIDDVFEMSNMGFKLDSDTPYTIDPTVYVDDDGQAYMHYGSFGRVIHVKLGADMISVSGKMTEISLGSINASDGKTDFFEAAFLTKRNGKWYEIYAAGSNPAAINYSTADNPAGPWKGGGRVIDPLPTTSTDGATNHSGVAEFAGQWYIVYHVSNGPNGGGTYHREVAVDKLNFNADGTIQKVVPSGGLTF